MRLERQTRDGFGKRNATIPNRAASPIKPLALIVSDKDTIAKEVEVFLLQAGIASERVKSMDAGCEFARSGRFQVVVASPVLDDGSWKRLAYIDSHNRPGFVIILTAINFDMKEWGQAIEDGAFEVLDALHELPRIGEIARRALWAAFLKGAGPCPEAIVTADVA